jgi:hypothetical protein
VEAAKERDERRPIGAEALLGSYEWIFVMDTAEGPHRSVAAVARERAASTRRGDHRFGAREGSRSVLPAADRQRRIRSRPSS